MNLIWDVFDDFREFWSLGIDDIASDWMFNNLRYDLVL